MVFIIGNNDKFSINSDMNTFNTKDKNYIYINTKLIFVSFYSSIKYITRLLVSSVVWLMITSEKKGNFVS